ncbi:aldo/keto reductase [Sciscionella sediminilitoris]|uniref:aldo/keto reductase n=1 Tax=Sciscionella sediminilitoris TaxID=1445613 RepID=UPI0004DF567E|nr:aldo/keto reductase [Sciscionella sp. SE31]
MRTTRLGRSELNVSRIAFGTWQIGGDWGSFEIETVKQAIRYAREAGINFFDTAQAYGFGASEQLLGEALREELRGNRDELVIATKGGILPGAERSRLATRANLRDGVEQSLRALGVEHIDLYQVHWPDPDTPAEETAGALQELVDEGKIRHAGVSNYDAEQLAAFDAVRPVETLQPPYHLLRREIEGSALPYTREHDIGVLVYSPLGSGLLTGSWTAETSFAEDDWRAKASAFTGDALRRNLDVVERLKEFGAARGLSVAQVALAWALAKDGVHVAIVGSRRKESIADSAAAAEIELSAADIAEIERIAADGVQIEQQATPEGIL